MVSGKTCQYTLQEIADYLGAELVIPGNIDAGDHVIRGLATLQDAGHGDLTFLSRLDYSKYLAECSASAVIVSLDIELDFHQALLRVDNPYLAYARVSSLFDTHSIPEPGIHPSAVVDATATVDATASIGANVVIGAGSLIGPATVISAGSVIGEDCQLGANCYLYPNVSINRDSRIGDRVRLHSGVVIGSDGFGFAPLPEGGWQKIHQLGVVRIGNDVEIGANTTVDRGAMGDTVIEDKVIIDNQVQVAHNVHIGEGTAIAAATAIAGSASIGAHCTIAGGVGIVGHITIADKVHITAMSMVTQSIRKAGSYSGGSGGVQATGLWRRNAVRFAQLDSIARRLRALEK